MYLVQDFTRWRRQAEAGVYTNAELFLHEVLLLERQNHGVDFSALRAEGMGYLIELAKQQIELAAAGNQYAINWVQLNVGIHAQVTPEALGTTTEALQDLGILPKPKSVPPAPAEFDWATLTEEDIENIMASI